MPDLTPGLQHHADLDARLQEGAHRLDSRMV